MVNTQSAPEAPRPELTVRAIVLGLILAVVMGAANVYVGLYAGMTVSASIPAAVMAMLVFRYVFKDRSILEANQVQTCASAGESLAAGIIFTMPALILMGTWTDFHFWTVTGVAFTGGLLGILMMIPMRKVFITESSDLPYPEGIACAAVLESGEHADSAGAADAARGLILGGLMGGLFKVAASFLGLLKPTLEGARAMGDRVLYFGGDVSPMLVAVGYIVRLNVSILLFLGGAIGWLIAIPLFGGFEAFQAGGGTVEAYPRDLWSNKVRYIGVGAMVVGGMSSIWAVRGGLVAAFQHLTGGAKGLAGKALSERDLPTPIILVLGLAAMGGIGALYYGFTGGNVPITLLLVVVALVAAFFFTAVASYIVGLVGNSNSPVSGMTITAVLAAGGLLYLVGYRGPEAAVATIGVAAVICCVACTSGDVCNDLKTGAIVGASPFRQQIMQISGVAVASLVMAPILTLLNNNVEGGIGGENLSAPQAGLFASLAQGFSGKALLPWNLILIGAAIGVGILVVDAALKASGAKFRAHLMPIAVGIYLPFSLAPPILIGGILSAIVLRGSKSDEESEARSQRGVLFCSGVIAGEALMGVGLAALAAVGVSSVTVTENETVTTWVTWAAVILGIALFASRTRAARQSS
ncbi:OPT oligopeptide transporter protein [Planctomycetes bacterium Poly30]|uniref:OPT oligopeptide transporter protein n=1 Tax=Saltatorellus ferox TaxID=2528018 RepID=A0A518EXW2_9BACT|nr:OPT oligopeptide transporter protein [Planctomycetes bacterium Poly30]